MATLVGRLPAISMPPETQFFPEIYREEDAAGPELAMRALENPRVRDLGLDTEWFMAAFRSTAMTHKDLFELIIRGYCDKAGKSRPGEKSPNHLHWAKTLLEWFPEARIIGVVRDGRDVANSLMAVPWSHNNIIKHSFDWVVSQEIASRLQADEPERFRLVMYERLLTETESVLKEVCGFLDEDYDRSILNAGDSGAVPEWEAGWKAKALREIDPSNIGKWRQRGYWDRLVMNTLMRSELRRNGYAVTEAVLPMRFLVRLISWPYHPKARPIFSRIKSALLGRPAQRQAHPGEPTPAKRNSVEQKKAVQ